MDKQSKPKQQALTPRAGRRGLDEKRGPKSKATGVKSDGTRVRNEVSFHCLRHTAISQLKAMGVSGSVARDLIGHDSAEISANYIHTSDESRKDAIDKLPDITTL